MRSSWAWALAWACLLATDAAATERSAAARYQFRKIHPCPATQSRQGACPGYVMDHVVPLCAGGADHPDNMQWQPVEAAKRKDSDERKACWGKRK